MQRYEFSQLDSTPGVPCPCGTSRRAFATPENVLATTHLVEIAEQQLPTFFIRDAGCLRELEQIVHFDLHSKTERQSYTEKLTGSGPVTIGITAGASCPNNLIEETILRVFALRGLPPEAIQAAA